MFMLYIIYIYVFIYNIYICIYIYILVAPCFKKSFKIRSWVPSPQMP